MTDSDDLAARVADLRKQIAYHNERYHTLDSPEIADADYDLLVRELLKLESRASRTGLARLAHQRRSAARRCRPRLRPSCIACR